MRNFILIFLAVGLGVGGFAYWKRTQDEASGVKPKNDPGNFRATTKKKGPGGFPGLPGGMKGMAPPSFGAMNSKAMFSDFVEEMEMTESEQKDFFEALKESERAMMDLAKIDSESGMPALPSPEKMQEHLDEREKTLTNILGGSGYKKFKAYSTTMPMRMTISRLEKTGLSLSMEQKQSVLYGAYEDIESGDVPASPQEFSDKMAKSILSRSSQYLSEDDQKSLEKAINEQAASRFGPGLPNLPPGLPAPPQLPSGGGLPVPAGSVP